MTKTLRRVALVTGAANGIGRATALLLARQGENLALLDRDTVALEDAAGEARRAGAVVATWGVDVAEAGEVEKVVQLVLERFERIDLMVHAAGVMSVGDIEECSPEEWNRVLSVNLGGAYAVCHAAVPVMKAQGSGAIVLVSSAAANSASTITGIGYVASKAGMLGMVRHMAYRLAPVGIRVNAVAPGFVDTAMPNSAFSPEVVDRSVSAIPARRMAHAEEVAEAIAYLASESAAYITGETLYITGGSYIR